MRQSGGSGAKTGFPAIEAAQNCGAQIKKAPPKRGFDAAVTL
jgi:hypothetical protein